MPGEDFFFGHIIHEIENLSTIQNKWNIKPIKIGKIWKKLHSRGNNGKVEKDTNWYFMEETEMFSKYIKILIWLYILIYKRCSNS